MIPERAELRLPPPLMGADDGPAIDLLVSYYAGAQEGRARYSGAYFDGWPNNPPDEFTADDLVAVTTLSVSVDPWAARKLLVSQADEFSKLLARVGPDRDLGLLEAPLDSCGPEWELNAALLRLPGVGPTTASKLFARKRPRLRPIYDSVIAEVTGCKDAYWEPLRQALANDDASLHHRLTHLRDAARLGPEVTALRVFDVITWMYGTHQT